MNTDARIELGEGAMAKQVLVTNYPNSKEAKQFLKK
jgi:hypothetical protein